MGLVSYVLMAIRVRVGLSSHVLHRAPVHNKRPQDIKLFNHTPWGGGGGGEPCTK